MPLRSLALADWRERYPEKFAPEETIFSKIRRGHHIFISTGCGEPQYLVRALVEYAQSHPKAIFDAEVFHVWTLGVAPYTDEKFKYNFRHNSFFIGPNTREAVNQGVADYTPIFLSHVPRLFARGLVPIDVALIQTSPPDRHGYMSLGVSVDITKAATERASLVIAQVNSFMPRVHGDGFIHIEDVDFIVPYDEPLLEFRAEVDNEIAQQIGKYVARIIQDGDTIQVGYGSIPNAILANLSDKKHLGVHTELLSDGIVALMKKGVIDNSRKTINRGKTVATFCMGTRETYEYLDDNPAIEFRTVDYTNNPLVIARLDNMTAINSALEIDLTGQASAESLGRMFFSGIGGQADFMRGAVLARNGKTILALPSTAHNETVSRIVPFLQEGAGVTLHRGDIHYVVTEYGIAYLHGKNIRERAMALIAIAHPKFRPWLIQEAKKLNLIYKDQAFIPGKRGEYPENLEIYRTTKSGLEILLRPVRISDEHLLKDFFYSLSDTSLYRRFISMRKDMPHERLQEFVVIDYTKEMVILATIKREEGVEEVVGLGQYGIDERTHTAEVAFVVRDDYQGQGIGTELLSYLTYLAKRQGLHGFTAEVLEENRPMLHLFEKMGFDIEKRRAEGVYELKMTFREQ
ncbi:MAG: GNAT family N-acetyltransferase [Candidatus Bipolaricaulota bacterium]|nr:GNAT family N-acetyltransferase [Candidatus Bipolaricaulota bacterium]MDW8111628.1 GNAT family N-acetyltransferase [Candidatus Bipolaricaulota bacterium]MDW8329361.1 GNAT family N-acetyltransferase [Candidatus Bipolaricaulota bacterium]